MIANIAAYSVLVLSKLGLKVAADKKWLPSGYYHKKSVEQLKDGNIEEAIGYNDIAIDKDPDSEKALIMRDLILMQQESKLLKIVREIKRTEEKIGHLQEDIKSSKDAFKKERRKYYLNFSLAFVLFLPILFSTIVFFFANETSTIFLWFLLFVCCTNIIGFVLLSRSFLEDKRIDGFVKRDEFKIIQNTLNKRLNENKGALEELKVQYQLEFKNFNKKNI